MDLVDRFVIAVLVCWLALLVVVVAQQKLRNRLLNKSSVWIYTWISVAAVNLTQLFTHNIKWSNQHLGLVAIVYGVWLTAGIRWPVVANRCK